MLSVVLALPPEKEMETSSTCLIGVKRDAQHRKFLAKVNAGVHVASIQDAKELVGADRKPLSWRSLDLSGTHVSSLGRSSRPDPDEKVGPGLGLIPVRIMQGRQPSGFVSMRSSTSA